MRRPGPPDWREILRRVWHKTGVPPHVAYTTLTLPELVMGCDDNFEPKPPAATDSGPTDPEAAAAWFRTLTPRNRLNLARTGEP